MIDSQELIPQRPDDKSHEKKMETSPGFKRKYGQRRIGNRVDRFNIVNLGANTVVGISIAAGAWHGGFDKLVNPSSSNAFEGGYAVHGNNSDTEDITPGVKIEPIPRLTQGTEGKNIKDELTRDEMERVMEVVPDSMKDAARDTIPLVVKVLSEYGINEPEIMGYAFATLEHEGLLRVMEEIDGREQAKKYNYSGGEDYYGRGFIMITHDYNYEKYGKKLGIDLKNHPELALEPEIAAKIFALWFRDEGTADYARKLDYVHARKTINPEEFNMDEEPFKSTPYEIADRAWQYLDALLDNKPGETRQDIIDEIIKNVNEQFDKLKAH